jgi:hypothetical protein
MGKDKSTEFLIAEPVIFLDRIKTNILDVNKTVTDLGFSQIKVEDASYVICPNIVFSAMPLTCNSRTKAALESRSSNDRVSFHSAISNMI